MCLLMIINFKIYYMSSIRFQALKEASNRKLVEFQEIRKKISSFWG